MRSSAASLRASNLSLPRRAVPLFALGRIKQNELLDFRQFCEQLFEPQIGPPGLRLLLEMVQQRDAEHAVEVVHPNSAIRSVMHGIPTEPVSIFQSAEHAFDRLLTRVAGHHVFGAPVQVVGEQNRSPQALLEQLGKSRGIKVELQAPAIGMFFQLIAEEFSQEAS